MHKFKQLNVYNKGIELGYEVRKMLKGFPKEEMFALSSQFRRAIDSVALNIAEGAGNNSKREFSKFLGYSIRSAYECICCMDISLKNKFIIEAEYDELFKVFDEEIAMLVGLQKSLGK